MNRKVEPRKGIFSTEYNEEDIDEGIRILPDTPFIDLCRLTKILENGLEERGHKAKINLIINYNEVELDIEVLNFSESDTTEHIRFNCRHTLKIMEKGYGCIDLFPPIQVEMETEDNEQSEIHNKIKTDVIEILQKPI